MNPATVTRTAAAALLIAAAVSAFGCGENEPAKPAPTPASGSKPAPAPAAPQAYAPIIDEQLADWAFVGNKKLNHWKVGAASVDPADDKKLAVAAGGSDLATDALVGVNLYTRRKFGDCRVELDAMIPAGGNSGVFLMGEYELQVLDDPAADPEKPTDMDFGAIARIAAPRVWAHEGPGKWQHFDITLTAPRFDADGKKTANAKVTVTINGKLVHDALELPEPTLGGLYGEEHATGPLMLQGNEGPAAFRDIRITPSE